MLPKAPTNIRQTQRQTIDIKGLDRTNYYTDGSFHDCNGITTDEYPYIKTRKRFTSVNATSRAKGTDMFAWDELLQIDRNTTRVWYGSTDLGRLDMLKPDGEAYEVGHTFPKQYVVAGNKICIFPDKVCIDLDMTELRLEYMGRDLYYVSNKAHMFYNNTESNLAVIYDLSGDRSNWKAFTSNLKVGHEIYISGTPSAEDEKAYEVNGWTSDRLYLRGQWAHPGTTSANEKSDKFRIQRYSSWAGNDEVHVIPDLDFVLAKDNKIYGCSNKYNTIYVSAQGDPFDFDTYEGVATDAYAVAVGTSGKFTGIAQVGSSVCFFKEECVHRLMGSYPAEYYLYQYNTTGVKEGCSGTVQSIDGVAYYFGNYGFTRFTGSEASIVSEALNGYELSDLDADYDGQKYWLASDKGVFIYDFRRRLWSRLYDIKTFCISHKGTDHYLSTANNVWKSSASGEGLVTGWSIEFNPFKEVMYSGSSRSMLFNKKRYVNFIFNIDLPQGSTFLIEVSEDGDNWSERKYYEGEKKGNVSVAISTDRLDKLAIRISGNNEMTLYAMEREFIISGSERK